MTKPEAITQKYQYLRAVSSCSLTPDTVELTRQWFANNQQECILDIQCGLVKLEDPEGTVKWHEEQKKQFLTGAYDCTFAFRQRALFIQTGNCLGLLEGL